MSENTPSMGIFATLRGRVATAKVDSGSKNGRNWRVARCMIDCGQERIGVSLFATDEDPSLPDRLVNWPQSETIELAGPLEEQTSNSTDRAYWNVRVFRFGRPKHQQSGAYFNAVAQLGGRREGEIELVATRGMESQSLWVKCGPDLTSQLDALEPNTLLRVRGRLWHRMSEDLYGVAEGFSHQADIHIAEAWAEGSGWAVMAKESVANRMAAAR